MNLLYLMRRPASWMTIWDDRILEFLRVEGPSTPKMIDDSNLLATSKSNISTRLGALQDAGLVRNIGDQGTYLITDRGEAYLDEELDLRASEDPSDVESTWKSVTEA